MPCSENLLIFLNYRCLCWERQCSVGSWFTDDIWEPPSCVANREAVCLKKGKREIHSIFATLRLSDLVSVFFHGSDLYLYLYFCICLFTRCCSGQLMSWADPQIYGKLALPAGTRHKHPIRIHPTPLESICIYIYNNIESITFTFTSNPARFTFTLGQGIKSQIESIQHHLIPFTFNH